MEQFGNQNGDTVFVSAYTSHPVLHIKKEGVEMQQRPFVMTFTDAIEKREHGGLVEAYKELAEPSLANWNNTLSSSKMTRG
jgi:hypothetical protein